MSTIPAGLKAKDMRERMEDKATITLTGSLYVGGPTAVTYYNGANHTDPIDAVETVELFAGAAGLPLVSNGVEEIPSYQAIGTDSIRDDAVTKDKLGNGTVVNNSNTKKVLSIHPDSSDSKILVIEYYDI